MKKTLAALGVLSALAAGSALAADVTLYGVLDLGLKYTHINPDEHGKKSTDSFTMEPNNQAGSRFGLKGSEELGNGWTAGFVLENGFAPDNGTMQQNNRLFGREASLHVAGPYGELAFGRMGMLTSGNGSYGIAGNLSPFGTSWSGYTVEASTFFVGYSRMDNTITYKSPTIAGFTAYAQHSFDVNSKDDWGDAKLHAENKASANRYTALGGTYKNGPLDLVLTADWYNWSNNYQKASPKMKVDDGYAVTLGGSYDFQVVKAYVGAQYFDHMLHKSNTNPKGGADGYATVGAGIDGPFNGYCLMAGVSAPLLGGTGMLAVGYTDTESSNKQDGVKTESTRWGASVGYDYPFSKRTNVYAVAGYYQDRIDNYAGAKGDDRNPSTTAAVIGVRHKF